VLTYFRRLRATLLPTPQKSSLLTHLTMAGLDPAIQLPALVTVWTVMHLAPISEPAAAAPIRTWPRPTMRRPSGRWCNRP